MASQIPTQIDPAVVALMHGMKMQEGGGTINYNVIGDKGTAAGAGQWSNQPNGKPVPLAQGQIPSNFVNAAKQYGLDPTDFSPDNQNKVLYAEISAGKAAGLTPEQILSQHNSGDPNAYSDSQRATGTGPVGAYNVVTYVKQAMGYAQKYAQTNTASTPPDVTTQNTTNSPAPAQDQGPSIGGFIDNSVSSIGNLIGGIGNVILHPVNTIKNLAQTAGGGVESLFGANNEDTQKFNNVVDYFKNRYGGNSVSEVVGNIGKTLYTDPAGAALDLSTLLDGVGGAIGAVGKIGALDAVRAAELAKSADFISTASGIIKGGTPEAIAALREPGTISKIGDAIQTLADYTNPLAPVTKLTGAVAQKVSDITDNLPRRIINNLLPQLKTNGLKDYAVDNLKIGSVDSMLKTSQDAIDNYSSQIKTILQHPDNAGIEISGQNIVNKVLKEFPNSEYTPEQIFAKMKTYVPGEAKLVTKLQDGSLNLSEANTLRQALDEISYKLKIDSPEIKAGKELAGTMGHAIRDSVQTLAPDTKPIFSNFSKEINLRKALVKLSQRSEKGGLVSVKDLLGVLGGEMVKGPAGAAATFAAEKISESPAIKVAGAKLIKNVIAPPIKTVAKVVKKIAPYGKEAAMINKSTNQ